MEFPENQAEKTWNKDGVVFSIVRTNMGHCCGYARFKARPTKTTGYDGILTYVPVHGGITYSGERKDGSMVYGFDCAHAGDESNPRLHEKDWLIPECERMAKGILAAAKVEDEYLLAEGDNEKRAEIIQKYHDDLGVEFNVKDNFGAMINLLCGSI